ncbi:MAG: arsenate reductase (glutaredoxin) [Motiliproteus sp.]|nr:arsenate reductase (glutaredoxin) [Motiliproteus sp.]MCW9053575.1 arsenate reductase (glutaredoxin) [Motiliproteus sp.]
MSDITLYHNPRCSKSRETLKLLQENQVEPSIRLYLEDVPSADEIKTVLSQLGISARQLLRTGEASYKENNLKDTSLSDDQLVAAMVEFPKLIQRPIAIRGDRAIIGRPPEGVLDLI